MVQREGGEGGWREEGGGGGLRCEMKEGMYEDMQTHKHSLTLSTSNCIQSLL